MIFLKVLSGLHAKLRCCETQTRTHSGPPSTGASIMVSQAKQDSRVKTQDSGLGTSFDASLESSNT